MDSKSYVDSLFADYEQSEVLADFKAELVSNLEARISAMARKGMGEAEAFKTAAKELADVSVVANELSLKKRQEVFAERYLDSRRYIKPLQAVLYAVCGVLLLLGVITGVMAFFTTGTLTAAFGTVFAFTPIAIAGFTFLGLTQETASSNPMKKRRAAFYAAAVFMLISAVLLAPLTWSATIEAPSQDWGGVSFGKPVTAALGVIVAFAIPAIALFIYLGLTEKPRHKPWVEEKFKRHCVYSEDAEGFFASPADAARFGVITGAIWMFAFAIFGLLWYFTTVLLALVVIPAAIGGTLLVQGVFWGKKSGASFS
ncbi:MAG: hypothetical protein LBC77_07175 [Spirochaetaceae bacterium]|nr:hypothetical protein [Spirochaetaceae bacterium]